MTPTPLSPDQWRLVNELFLQALDLPEPDRAVFLTSECAHEATIRQEVLSLLRSHESATDGFLEKSPASRIARALLEVTSPEAYRNGETHGDFRIIRLLGRGSFGAVYLALQISLDRRVALKVSPNIGREARNMAHLEHDNIVKVYSETVHETTNCRWLCMQWVPGLSLETALTNLERKPAATLNGAAILAEVDRAAGEDAAFTPGALKDRERLGRMSATEASVWMAARLADALAYAHARGVLHLDVKPGNILLSPYGRPLLTDFNIAADRRAEKECILGGTVRYMPPEQQKLFETGDMERARAGLDERSDVYALGIVLSEMVERLTRKPLAEIDIPCVPEVVERCTRPDPADRFASAQDVARALDGCLERHEIEKALPPKGPVARGTEQWPVLMTLVFMLTPHVLGSVINITYNQTHIVSDLSDGQKRLFHSLCLVYNGIIYPVCIFLYFRLLRPMIRLLRDPSSAQRHDGRTLEERGRCVLMLPLGLVFVATLGWMPGSVFFPLLMHLKAGPMPPSSFGHFFISFTVSWLVASAYSFLYIEYIALRVLYPRLCLGESGVRLAARRQLGTIAPGMRALHYTAGFAPLVSAALIVYVGPDAENYHAYRLLITVLIGSGIVGLLFAIRGSALMQHTVTALTGGYDGRMLE